MKVKMIKYDQLKEIIESRLLLYFVIAPPLKAKNISPDLFFE